MACESVVSAWICDVQDAHACAQTPPAAERPTKRRRALQRINANPTMPPPSSSPAKRRGRGPPARRSRTPPRRSARTANAGENDATPRPSRAHAAAAAALPQLSSHNMPPLHPSDTTARYAASLMSAQPQPQSPTRSKASSRRSASPVKDMAYLASNAAFDTLALGDILEQASQVMGATAFELYRKLLRLNRGRSVVPAAVRTRIESTVAGMLLDLGDENYAADDTRDDFTLRYELEDIWKIERCSRTFELEQDFEAAWNEDVHKMVLEVALRPYEVVCYRNITRAEIAPKDLIPAHCTGAALQGKMVDYAICLDPPPTTRARIRQALDAEARGQPASLLTSSVNQTAHPPLRYRPIAVSIETKTPDGDESAAKAQLAVWSAAQLERMRRLDPTGDLPTLPLVLISGVDWDLYFVTAARAGRTQLIGSHRLGDTKSLLGIYKLVEGIRTLADWARDDLCAWWDRLLDREWEEASS